MDPNKLATLRQRLAELHSDDPESQREVGLALTFTEMAIQSILWSFVSTPSSGDLALPVVLQHVPASAERLQWSLDNKGSVAQQASLELLIGALLLHPNVDRVRQDDLLSLGDYRMGRFQLHLGVKDAGTICVRSDEGTTELPMSELFRRFMHSGTIYQMISLLLTHLATAQAHGRGH